MAASLNWNAETISSSDGASFVRAQLIVRSNVATVTPRNREQSAVKRAGVQGIFAVEGFPTTKRRIVFDDGTEWLVSRKRGCNCR